MKLKPSQALASHRESIRRVVESHHARNARVFGSVVRGDDTEDSDLDILIDPTPETTCSTLGRSATSCFSSSECLWTC